MSQFATVSAEIDDLREGKLEEGELHGRVLGIVHAIYELPGENFSDEQCLWMIHDVINHWSDRADKGEF